MLSPTRIVENNQIKYTRKDQLKTLCLQDDDDTNLVNVNLRTDNKTNSQ